MSGTANGIDFVVIQDTPLNCVFLFVVVIKSNFEFSSDVGTYTFPSRFTSMMASVPVN